MRPKTTEKSALTSWLLKNMFGRYAVKFDYFKAFVYIAGTCDISSILVTNDFYIIFHAQKKCLPVQPCAKITMSAIKLFIIRCTLYRTA